jgi:hypothetical protein
MVSGGPGVRTVCSGVAAWPGLVRVSTAVFVQPDGDIVATGSSANNATGISDIALARYLR